MSASTPSRAWVAQEPAQGPLRPAWGPITGWALVGLAIVLLAIAWDEVATGGHLLALVLALVGLVLATTGTSLAGRGGGR